eukprot:1107340-Rhodomonas_salina.4
MSAFLCDPHTQARELTDQVGVAVLLEARAHPILCVVAALHQPAPPSPCHAPLSLLLFACEPATRRGRWGGMREGVKGGRGVERGKEEGLSLIHISEPTRPRLI